MKPMTEEWKQHLIAHCKVVMSVKSQGSPEYFIAEIALASLMAEKLRIGALDDNGDEYTLEFYTAPPVQVIKLPSAELIKEVFLANGFKEKIQPDGSKDLNIYVYDAALALIERLNGLGE